MLLLSCRRFCGSGSRNVSGVGNTSGGNSSGNVSGNRSNRMSIGSLVSCFLGDRRTTASASGARDGTRARVQVSLKMICQ